MSALGSILAHPGADRAALREKLEQGVFALVAIALCVFAFAGLGILNADIQCGADVNAPVTHFGKGFFAPEAMAFKVTPQGEFVANGTWIPLANLPGFVRDVLADKPDTIFTLEADRTLPYRQVRSALQLFEGLGAGEIYLVTNQDESPLLKLFSEPRTTKLEGN